MKSFFANNADWYRAMTLRERAATLDDTACASAGDGDFAAAEARLQRWQQPPTFANAESFACRLRMEGLTEPQLLRLLAEPAQALARRFPEQPDWLQEIAAAYDHLTPLPAGRPIPDTEMPYISLLRLAAPLIAQARYQLQMAIQQMSDMASPAPFDPETVDTLFLPALIAQFGQAALRTLTLELNVARLQGRLTGQTAEERFQSFVELLGQPEYALGLLLEYPVLARQLVTATQLWIEFTREFLQHLCTDWKAILAAFAPDTMPGRLVEIRAGGDTHRGGRTVLIARFESGLHLVYKPRSLAVDVHFQELLAWLNAHGAEPAFRTLTVLERGDYGWVEYVTEEACPNEAAMRRFYERQGGYLALLYALEATDFHFENLIAAGENPVLLDLEALFHPRIWDSEGGEASDLAWNMLGDSVLRIGLLPHRAQGMQQAESMDLSGLGSTAGQMTPYTLPQWEALGTDSMHLVRKAMPLPEGKHQPVLHGEAGRATEYTDAIEAGFVRMYRLLERFRAELLAESGPLERFAADPVRVLVRNTQQYALLLNESFHPDMCRDALDRDRLLDRLWRGVALCPTLARVLPSEQRDLIQGDIPLFTGRPGTRDLWDSREERISDFCVESGLDLARHRLQSFSEEDMARQTWIVRSSLLTITPTGARGHAPGVRTAMPERPQPLSLPNQSDLLELAQAVGDRLAALALHGENDAAWLGLTLRDENHWSFAPAELDLYDGLPGIILFLAHLGAVTGEARYTALAQAALNTVRAQIARSGAALAIGAFAGYGGLLYLFARLSVLWEQPQLLQEVEMLLERLPSRIEADTQFDIISGSAGCLVALLSFADRTHSERAMELARLCGQHLVQHARPQAEGVGWVTLPGSPPLTGFSHGVAGIAHALLELWARTGDEVFRTTACAGLTYERSLFSTQAGNWPDLRCFETDPKAAPDKEPQCAVAWCHGAPGIGLARLCALRHLNDPLLLEEIEAAVKATLERGLDSGHSLCHGGMGNLELVWMAQRRLPERFGQLPVGMAVAGMVESIRQNGWLCGNPLNVESPGLMTGIAGIGYGLLHLAVPEQVPSVLTLESAGLK
jgi:type 2 lantibiotic biosynthesis protein LanM